MYGCLSVCQHATSESLSVCMVVCLCVSMLHLRVCLCMEQLS